MSSRPLGRCGLAEETLRKVQARGISTSAQLLIRSVVELSEELDVSPAAARDVQLTVARAICPSPCTAAQLCSAIRPVASTGLGPLDGLLRGGLAAGGITELVGPAGVGKTQMCLQLTARTVLQSVLSGRSEAGSVHPGVIYIDTENKFSSHRLAEIGEGQLKSAGLTDQSAIHEAIKAMQERVILIPVTSLEDLVKRSRALEVPCIDHEVGLIVIDSVASIVRSWSHGDAFAGQDMLSQVAVNIKRLAEALRMPTLVTNQVTTRFSSGPSHGVSGFDAEPGSSSSSLGAAMGTAWAHAVNTRLVMQLADGSRRAMKIAKSPTAPAVAFYYRVTLAGIETDRSPAVAGHSMSSGNVLELRIDNTTEYMPFS